jgi:hypothetical protein
MTIDLAMEFNMTQRYFVASLCVLTLSIISERAWCEITPAEVRSIAKEAYVYGFPLVDNYRVMYAYSIDKDDPEYKAPFNVIANMPRVYTPEDQAVQTPNSDMPYSMLTVDLRAEPVVLTLPKVEQGRYYSVQLIDLYTFNFAYLGSRTTGSDGGSFLVAGPGWKGATPPGIAKVLRSETELAMVAYRTQMFKPTDLENVREVQAGYKVQPLSSFLGEPAPPPAPQIEFIEPLTAEQERTSLDFFDELAFVLQFCPTHSSEAALRERFAKIGIEPGRPFGTAFLSAKMKSALAAGMAEGQQAIDARRNESKSSADLLGTRDYLQNDFLNRATGTQVGIYANSKEEAFYIPMQMDAGGQPLEGSEHRYTLTFAPNSLPPVKAFWSLTMYSLPQQLLVANPIDRYLINSPMLPDMVRDEDGGITICIQKDPPGGEKDANWLPSPAGRFVMVLRLYWPEQAVLDGAWQAPPVERVE